VVNDSRRIPTRLAFHKPLAHWSAVQDKLAKVEPPHAAIQQVNFVMLALSRPSRVFRELGAFFAKVFPLLTCFAANAARFGCGQHLLATYAKAGHSRIVLLIANAIRQS
jgi:hypothetical protein